MTHQITVPTPFADIAELAESFASRVDEERLMLPHSESIPENEWVEFAVTLGSGDVGLGGVGRCTGSFDNGEDRAAEHRFDVVMDQLQFDEMSQVYFERILNVRATQMGEEPVTGEVEVPAEVAEQPAFEEPPAEVSAEEVSFEEPAADVSAEAAAEQAAAEAAFEPPPIQAITASGRRPSRSRICARASRPMMLWKSRTIIG